MAGNVETLSVEDALFIHEVLVRDFAESGDPISPPGVRSIALLESAVHRQFTGSGGSLKYPDAFSNAATLMYGLCNDHPFHNGNKRTALVGMLAHLDRNRLSLQDVNQRDLYGLMIATAAHTLRPSDPRKKTTDRTRPDSDQEVATIARWLERRCRGIVVGERQITFRQLRRLLEGRGYTLAHPKGNSIDVLKYERVKVGFLKRREEVREKHIMSIGYPGDNKFVPIGTIKQVRRVCNLTEADGLDSRSFYDEEAVVDGFVCRYAKILKKLARR